MYRTSLILSEHLAISVYLLSQHHSDGYKFCIPEFRDGELRHRVTDDQIYKWIQAPKSRIDTLILLLPNHTQVSTGQVLEVIQCLLLGMYRPSQPGLVV